MNKKKQLTVLFFVLFLLFVSACIASVSLGSVNLSFDRLIGAINGTDKNAEIIVWGLRLPRLLGAALAGAALASAGQMLQAVTNNELCAPNIVGINSGAGLAVMLVLCLFPSLWPFIPAAAFVGALAASGIVIAISSASRERRTALVLGGVALSSLLGGGISMLSLRFPDALSSYAAFSAGGFSGVALSELAVPAVMIGVGLMLSFIMAPKVGVLCLGDEAASALGVNVRLVRTLTVIIASGLCAAAVSFAGLLGFVGLIVPHVSRKLAGHGLRTSLPFTALMGSILVIFSDLVGRILFPPGEIPAGIIMSAIGAPFFIYLLIRGRKHDRI